MPIYTTPDGGSYYAAPETFEDKAYMNEDADAAIAGVVVSFEHTPDLESWVPYSVSLHHCSSEGGSMLRALWTFGDKEEAHKWFLQVQQEIESGQRSAAIPLPEAVLKLTA